MFDRPASRPRRCTPRRHEQDRSARRAGHKTFAGRVLGPRPSIPRDRAPPSARAPPSHPNRRTGPGFPRRRTPRSPTAPHLPIPFRPPIPGFRLHRRSDPGMIRRVTGLCDGFVVFFHDVSVAEYLLGGGSVPMGLCLYVLGSEPGGDEDPEEIAECDVGHYSDFGCFRNTIARHLGATRYPTLMEHSDCDGQWSLAEIPTLERELRGSAPPSGDYLQRIRKEHSSTQLSIGRGPRRSTTASTTSMARTYLRRCLSYVPSPRSTAAPLPSCRRAA